MYVDESGDAGLLGSPTTHFVLSGMVIHESQWRPMINQLQTFRQRMRALHGLPIRTEIHSAPFLRHPPILGMAKHVRLAILRNFLDELASVPTLSFTHVVVPKAGKPAGYDIFEQAWKTLIQRFENTLLAGNFPGGFKASHGLLLTDPTNGKALQRMVRRMAVYNPIPSRFGGVRNVPLLRIIEDPSPRDSASSYMIQAADVAAYFAYQRFHPNKYIKRSGAQHYFDRLAPVLNLKASAHPLGIVVL